VRPSRKEILRVLGLVLVAWVGALVLIAWVQRARPASGPAGKLTLPRYPGTESAPCQTSPNLGMEKYWFTLNEDYPSKSVYYWYKNELEPRGYVLVTQREPDWVRRGSGDKSYDLFQATWLEPGRLFQIDLQMVSTVTRASEGEGVVVEQREPGIKVYVTRQRVMHPELMFGEEREKRPPRSEIELR